MRGKKVRCLKSKKKAKEVNCEVQRGGNNKKDKNKKQLQGLKRCFKVLDKGIGNNMIRKPTSLTKRLTEKQEEDMWRPLTLRDGKKVKSPSFVRRKWSQGKACERTMIGPENPVQKEVKI